MGPALYKHKPKKGETIFSVRALPIGGYVAIAGEEEDDKERTNKEIADVPKERTIAGISWWKQVLIFVAGVTVNFILGFIFFAISYTCCPQPNLNSNKIVVASSSKFISVSDGKIKEGDSIIIESIDDMSFKCDGGNEVMVLNTSQLTDSYNDITYYLNLSFLSENERNLYIPKAESDYRKITFTVSLVSGEKVSYTITTNAKVVSTDEMNSKTYAWDTIGFTPSKHFLGFAEGMKQASIAFGNGTVALFKAIGQLFTPQGWNNVGGIISVFQLSETAVNSGAAVFFSYWGLISVNLAIFNLIPIPGLDGWQIVVAAIEGISKKKVPSKAKKIVTIIGFGLLFLLMFVLLIKDIVMMFI